MRNKEHYENRIQLLSYRNKDNGNIIKKIKRKIRSFEKLVDKE